MDNNYYITTVEIRKSGKHLTAENRGAIQHLHKLGYSNRFIARELNCSPSTIGYELAQLTLVEDVNRATLQNVVVLPTKPIDPVVVALKP